MLLLILIYLISIATAGPILCSGCTAWALAYCTGSAPVCGFFAAICWGVCSSAAVASCMATCIAPTP